MLQHSTIKFNLMVVGITVVFAGCAGGGGSSNLTNTSSYNTPVLAGTIDPLVGTSEGYAITTIKSKDINADGVDEVVIGGRESQLFVDANHQKNQLAIFGWNNNSTKLTNETSTWFSGSDNVITGTEPSIKFGNFTGQAGDQLDMFVAGGTDSDGVLAPSIIFKNNGNNTFTRVDLPGSDGWAHGSDVGDINGDGIDDMISVGYGTRYSTTILGGPTPSVIQNNSSGGDSVTLGEFLGAGNGTYALFTNGTATPTFQKFNTSTKNWDSQGISIIDEDTNLAVNIPTGRHTIRIQAIEVNDDGLQDFLMITRPNNGENGWDESTQKSYVEFYKNLGGGKFEKTALFFKDNALFYNVEVKDIDGDGVDDIFLGSTGDGSTVLMGNANGSDIVYAEASAEMIAQFEDEISENSGIGAVNIVKGPGGKSYLVGTAKSYNGDNQLEKVYYSEITNSGVVTLDENVAALQEMWPQLSAAEAEEILSLTGTQFSNGVITNLAKAHNPVGQLLIPTRTGRFVPMRGSVSGVNFGGSAKMIATDSFNRGYNINMSGTAVDGENLWTKRTFTPTDYSSAALSLSERVVTLGDYKFSTNSDNQTSFAYSGIRLSDDFGLQVSLAQLSTNPWLNLSGAWGKISGANLAEISGVYTKSKYTIRGGIIRTTTEFQPGLVTEISPITSAWTDVEFGVNENFTLGSGIFPTAVSGDITAEIPTGVDSNGEVKYKSVKADIISSLVGYARMNYSNQLKNHKNITYGVSTISSTTKNASLFANIKIVF